MPVPSITFVTNGVTRRLRLATDFPKNGKITVNLAGQPRPSDLQELTRALQVLNSVPATIKLLTAEDPAAQIPQVVLEITYTLSSNVPLIPGGGPPPAQSFRVKTQPTKGKGATGTAKGAPVGEGDPKAKGATVRGTIRQASKATVSITANKQTKVYQVSDKLTQVFQEVNGKDTPASLAQLQQALKANPGGVAGSVTAGPASAAGSQAAVIRYTLPSRATARGTAKQ